MRNKKIVIVGGGAAGFFGALNCAAFVPGLSVTILEKTQQLLSKVRISGGGRCNVTHSCFDPAQLISYYPRGSQELRSAFTRFQPSDTWEWFVSHGVELKTESDGRMFPVTDDSTTIISCFLREAQKYNIEIRKGEGVQKVEKISTGFLVQLEQGEVHCDAILVATGSSPQAHKWIAQLGHTIIPAVPSLFTFTIKDLRLDGLAGVSVPMASLKIKGTQQGPLLITHWGLSGPGVLKLSAWEARELHACGYKAELQVNWLPQLNKEKIREKLVLMRETAGRLQIGGEGWENLPRQLWKRLLLHAGIDPHKLFSQVAKAEIQRLVEELTASKFAIEGKSLNKEEFVTCGGVCRSEVDFRTMESHICPGMFFAGEVLDIDGVTGGFNFQNAWTTSWIAAQAMSEKLYQT